MAESKAVQKLAIPNPDYSGLVARQREFFLSGATRPVSWRKAQLEALKALFTENHDDLCDALWKELRRNVVDADLMDVAYNLKEADYALKHLDEWMKPKRVHTPLILQPGHVRVRRDPLGVTLIIGAWNEPFMLLFAPLAAAFAGGNTAVLKPSELAVACSAAVARVCRSILTRAPLRSWKAPSQKQPPYWHRNGISSSSPTALRSARLSIRRRPGT